MKGFLSYDRTSKQTNKDLQHNGMLVSVCHLKLLSVSLRLYSHKEQLFFNLSVCFLSVSVQCLSLFVQLSNCVRRYRPNKQKSFIQISLFHIYVYQ